MTTYPNIKILQLCPLTVPLTRWFYVADEQNPGQMDRIEVGRDEPIVAIALCSDGDMRFVVKDVEFGLDLLHEDETTVDGCVYALVTVGEDVPPIGFVRTDHGKAERKKK